MTTITFMMTTKDEYLGFETSGHAGFAKYGKDIVCSALSILSINTVNSIDEFTDAVFDYEQNEENGYMRFQVTDHNNESVQLLMKSFYLGVSEMGKQYPRNVRITIRRCKP